MVELLCELYNCVFTVEYLPACFQVGVQELLYNGKDTCVLDLNNYQGITLLSISNRMFYTSMK